MPQNPRDNTPLSRAALAWRFAIVAVVSALALLPFFPTEYLYHRAALFGYGGALKPGIHWRVALLLPIVAFSAFGLAYVWASRAGRVYFSSLRGLLCAVLAFFYAAVFVSLLSHWLSDETLPFLRLAVIGLLFFPYLWLIPAIGAVAGSLLARRIAHEPTHPRARLRHAVQPLVLSVVPLLVIVGIAHCLPPRLRTAAASALAFSTASAQPVLQGKWLRAGTFVDLVGSFSPERREADDDVVRGARIFVDTFEGALSEAGDLLQPLTRGVISRASIEADLAGLVQGEHPGRRDSRETVVFKSVGTGVEDLATARWVAEAGGLGEVLGAP